MLWDGVTSDFETKLKKLIKKVMTNCMNYGKYVPEDLCKDLGPFLLKNAYELN